MYLKDFSITLTKKRLMLLTIVVLIENSFIVVLIEIVGLSLFIYFRSVLTLLC